MQLDTTTTELSLFQTATQIQLGNGHMTKFWHDRWLHGQAPKVLAPLLYKKVWRKNITVAQALDRRRWMKGLQHISNVTELHQFVDLWIQVQEVQLTEQPDCVIWRYASSGIYTSQSYNLQFTGSYADFN
uniref:Reverse transcriptase zinc-binding domain-containing protein n=1 Tax=Arundo donax TaxID=35708 RepID=A0A0A9E6B3_ARUDO